MAKSLEGLSRIFVAFVIMLIGLYLIYPEGFSIISDAISDNLVLILAMLVLWFLFSIWGKRR